MLVSLAQPLAVLTVAQTTYVCAGWAYEKQVPDCYFLGGAADSTLKLLRLKMIFLSRY